MQRRWVAAVCVLLAMGIGSTRPATGQSVQVGVVGGAAISTLVGGDTEGSQSRTTPLFGVQLVLQKASSVVGLETGALYVSKGAAVREDGMRGDLKIAYLEVPILLRISVPLEGSTIRPVITAGGSLGIRSGCKIGLAQGSTSVEVGCDDSTLQGTFDLKQVDFGLSVGAALDIPAGSRLLIAPGVRYTRGLSVIGDTSDNADAKNSSIELRVAVRLRSQ